MRGKYIRLVCKNLKWNPWVSAFSAMLLVLGCMLEDQDEQEQSLIAIQEDQDEVRDSLEDTSDIDQDGIGKDNHTYVYNDIKYTFAEWSLVGTGNESMVALGDTIYVFDTAEEARAFEEGDFQSLLSDWASNLEQSTLHGRTMSVGDIVYGTAIYRLSLYEHKDYKGSMFSFYNAHKIGHKRTRIGYEWVNDRLEQDLPTSFRKKTSSYKMEYLQVPKINGYWMVLEMRLRTGLLGADRNVDWKKKLYQNPEMGTSNTLEQNSNLKKHRIWASLGIPHWNDKIQAFTIRFNSY